MKKLNIFLSFLFLAFGMSMMAQTVVRVVPSGGSTDNDGSSWSNAVTIERAIAIIQGLGDKTENQVWLKAGAYNIATFLNIQDVNLYGGFAGDETTLSARNWAANQTIIDGTGTTAGCMGMNTASMTGSIIIDGLIFQNCTNATGNGGVLSLQCSVANATGYGIRLSNCIFRNNKVTGTKIGSTLFAKYVTASIDNCLFANNESAAGGGLFQFGGGPVTIVNCTMAYNKATTTMFNYSTATGTVITVNLYNTNLFGNASTAIFHVAPTTTTTIGYNCASDLTNTTDADRLLASDGNILLSASPFVAGAGFAGTAAGTNTFEMVTTANYNLAAGSPCIDAGTAAGIALSNSDLSKKSRTTGSQVDMGAYEYSLPTGFQFAQKNEAFHIHSNNGILTVSGIAAGNLIKVYSATGQLIASKISETVTNIPLGGKGLAIVVAGKDAVKVVY